ncbi:hypothetical protein PTSG_03671 [Salpingoeca rosetta]|uniref:Mediator of RNA polymerase II transcription subunit 17 n=1 Tax=Salpingoeca rosetta (strain ATCC 50818 / BSB-021) TaxID=946362 RepID=F2U692_SALR5|nr:uncharacterized protein PTSG_03671 [Salpingoeca rosetta]EGD83033.1 hypothetical protein PTSG_03671 [Salpingoeca rosetta]|eukprot:XP_004995397.1 hypothetical protein PTSG_03671 [Salpingoeca rosetta]
MDSAKRAKVQLEGHTEVPVAQYTVDGKEEHVNELKAASRAFQVLTRLDFEKLEQAQDDSHSTTQPTKLADGNGKEEKKAEETEETEEEASHLEEYEQEDKSNLQQMRALDTAITAANDQMQMLIAVLNMAQKTQYLDMERVAVPKLEFSPAARLQLKRQQMHTAAETLRGAITRLHDTMASEVQRFSQLTQAASAFRIVRSDGRLFASVAPGSRIVRARNPDHQCSLSFSQQQRQLLADVPISLRANTDIRVYAGHVSPDALSRVRIQPPSSHWLSALQAAQRHAHQLQLFNMLLRGAGDAGDGITCTMPARNAISLTLGPGIQVVVCLHFSDIPAKTPAAASIAATNEAPLSSPAPAAQPQTRASEGMDTAEDSGGHASGHVDTQQQEVPQAHVQDHAQEHKQPPQQDGNETTSPPITTSTNTAPTPSLDDANAPKHHHELTLLLKQLHQSLVRRRGERELRRALLLYKTSLPVHHDRLPSLVKSFAAIADCKLRQPRITQRLKEACERWQRVCCFRIEDLGPALHKHKWSIVGSIGSVTSSLTVDYDHSEKGGKVVIKSTPIGRPTQDRRALRELTRSDADRVMSRFVLNCVLNFIESTNADTVCALASDEHFEHGTIHLPSNRVVRCELLRQARDFRFVCTHGAGPFHRAPAHPPTTTLSAAITQQQQQQGEYDARVVAHAISHVLAQTAPSNNDNNHTRNSTNNTVDAAAATAAALGSSALTTTTPPPPSST